MNDISAGNDYFEQALEMLEEGKSIDEVLKTFPENADEILEYSEITDFLKAQQIRIKPSKKCFQETIDILYPQKKFSQERDWGVFWQGVFKRSWQGAFAVVGVFLIGFVLWDPSLMDHPNDMDVLAATFEEDIAQDLEDLTQELEAFESMEKEVFVLHKDNTL